MKKNSIMFSLICVMLLASCTSTGSAKKDTTVSLKSKDVSFKSESGSLTINNETSSDLVIFVGRVEKSAILGGISKNTSRSFDLSKISGIPDSGSLLIRAATYDNYKGKAKITEDDVIFTGLVVYDLNDSADKINLSIYKDIDLQQKSWICVCNESRNFVLELRLDSPDQGEIIATLPPLAPYKNIFLDRRTDGYAYYFYPTWVYVNPKTGEKTSMNAGITDRQRSIPSADPAPLRFEGPSKSSIGYDVAFISLQNDTRSSIEFRNGNYVRKNQKGNRLTESGRTDVYEIESTNGESGQTYSGLYLNFDNGENKSIAVSTFKPGYKYELVVTEQNGIYQYAIREVGMKSLVDDARIELFNE